MDKYLIVFLVVLLDCLVLIASSSSAVKSSVKDNEDLESFIRLTLPIFKQNMINRQELDSFYNMLANSDDNSNLVRSEHKKKSLDVLESVKRKSHDDYGHLRFGRNDPNQANTLRIKYNDPDYGHMRFG